MINKTKWWAVTFADGREKVLAAKDLEDLGRLIRALNWHHSPYNAIQVKFPEPPTHIHRPDWTHQVGATWISDLGIIYTNIGAGKVMMAMKDRGEGACVQPAWADTERDWTTIKKL